MDFKNCYYQIGVCNFHIQLLFFLWGGGGGWGRVKFWYTTLFWSPHPVRPRQDEIIDRSIRSLQGTEFSVVVVICLLGLFWTSTLTFYKRSETFIWSVTICLFRYNMYSCNLIFIRLFWIYLLPINLTLSLVHFISIITSITFGFSRPGKNDVTYKSIERVVVSLSVSVPKDKYDMQEKQRCTILFFFQYFNHFLTAPVSV